MHSLTFRALFLALGLGVLTPAPSHAGEADLIALLPEETLGVVHVRSMPALRARWAYNPLAKTLAEPEVQAFLAPAMKQFDREHPGGLAQKIEAETGMSIGALLDLFPGEIAFVIPHLSSLISDDGEKEPDFFFLAQIGEDPKPIETLFDRLLEEASEASGEDIAEEEFQGEIIRSVRVVEEGEESPKASFSWTLLDGLLVLGTAKQDVQQVIDNVRRGGPEASLFHSPGFQAIYREDPDAHIVFYVGLRSVIEHILDQISGKAGQASMLAMAGLTPRSVVSALGLDKLTALYGAGVLGRNTTSFTTGIKWSEYPEIMRVLAYGDPPAPRPGFVSADWVSVSSARFSLGGMYDALKDVLRESSPALITLLEMRIAGMNQALGIDLERDLMGNFGDEIIQAEALNGRLTDAQNPLPTEQLFALSIKDADLARRVADALMTMMPSLSQFIDAREYLGESIHSFTPPSSPDGPGASGGIAYAITRSYLFISTGGAAMLETAIQGLDGASDSIWDSSEIAEALDALPAGESMIAYQDTKRIIATVFDLMTKGGSLFSDPENPEGSIEAEDVFDFDAKPSPQVLAQHWGTSVSAAYVEADGVRSVGRLNHGATEISE